MPHCLQAIVLVDAGDRGPGAASSGLASLIGALKDCGD
jgi:hypothetical protein